MKVKLKGNKIVMRRRCTRCSSQGLSKMDAPDLTIFYSKDGEEWEQYLDKCFHQLIPYGNSERPLHIHSEMLENLTVPLMPDKIKYVLRSKAQLVILTPEFLDFVQTHCEMMIGQMFEPTRVIAMLCGIDTKDVEDVHRAQLVSFPSWQTMPVLDQDQNFVLQLFHKTVEIMDASEANEVLLKPRFKLTPRKVKEGCNKVYALLNSAVASDQEIKVFIKHEEKLKEIPSNKRNPFTVQFLIPDNFFISSQIISIQITCDGTALGIRQIKCESKMGELQHLLGSVRDPMAFLCQTLGLSVNMTKELDNILATSFKKNLPHGFDVLELSRDIYARKSDDEMPTLLHFAAHYGLKELCSLLLDCPGAKIACNIRNAAGYCPPELAEISGYQDLAQMLENFANLAATRDLYSFMSTVSEDTDSHKIYESLYDYPSSIPLYDSPMSIPIPVTSSLEEEVEDDYLPMSSSSSTTYLEPHQRLLLGIENPETDYKVPPQIAIEVTSPEVASRPVSSPARFQGYTQSQIELIGLLEDFKKNKFSLNEVEQLFEDWKKRQSNQQSFKEKEEQLAFMRTKYEEIQLEAPEKSRMAMSLMEKIMTLLPNKMNRKLSPNVKTKTAVSTSKIQEVEFEDSSLRPVSTFSTASFVSSISSSSSSDRLSTISSTSNYDSGAQSDSGDDIVRNHRNTLEKQLQRRGSMEQFLTKKWSSSINKERILQLGIPLNRPPLPSHDSQQEKRNDNGKVARPLPPKVPQKPLKLPSSSGQLQRSEYLSNIEERKPMPPPRPERTLPPKNSVNTGSNEEKNYQNISPDYVIPDPDFSVYQTPISPPQSIFNDSPSKNQAGKRALMPSKRSVAAPCTMKKTPSPREIPDYINLSSEAVQLISQQYTKTQHNDYYNWSATDKNQKEQLTQNLDCLSTRPRKIEPSNKNADNSGNHQSESTYSQSPKTNSAIANLATMKGRPLPDVP